MKQNQSTCSDLSFIKSQQTQLQTLCKSNKPSKIICFNKNCSTHPFVCDDQLCSCQKDHQLCFTTKINTIKYQVQQNIISTKSIQDSINQNVDTIIDQLSNFRDQILINLKQNFYLCGLTILQKEFLESLNLKNNIKINGNKIWSIIQNIYSQNKVDSQMLKINNYIDKLSSQFKLTLQPFSNSIDKQINQFKKFVQKQTSKVFQKDILINNQQNIFIGSKIIDSKQEIITIRQFFSQNKIITKSQLFYRASQNDFQVKKFHQKCDSITNTITLCQTQFNKKIGAFTPLPWQSQQVSYYQKDQSSKSFIFSITQKDKFILQEKSKELNTSIELGPGFGGGKTYCDLLIKNKANGNKDSFASINNAYKNVKYKKGDKQSFERFCGNKDSMYFQVKQWQVWRIQFE